MPLHLEVITPEGKTFEEDVDMVIAPGSEGFLGILPHHVPLLTALGPGEFRVKQAGTERTLAVFGGFMGESYADIPTVAKTVGLVPPETRAARAQEFKEIADFAKLLGCKVVALHIGFVPHDTANAIVAALNTTNSVAPAAAAQRRMNDAALDLLK